MGGKYLVTEIHAINKVNANITTAHTAAGIFVVLCRFVASPAFLGCFTDKISNTNDEIIASVKMITE